MELANVELRIEYVYLDTNERKNFEKNNQYHITELPINKHIYYLRKYNNFKIEPVKIVFENLSFNSFITDNLPYLIN